MTVNYQFSAEAEHITRSVMRELLAHAVDPDMISFANGLPANELLPVENLKDCFNSVITARALQYGPPYLPLREWIAEYMQQRGVTCTAENIYITNGSQQGLTILSRLFLDHGDVAVIEDVTFTGIKKITAGYLANVRTVPTNLETGVDVAALEAALAREPRPKLAVLIPDFHNPLGVSITAEKRQKAAALANQYGVPLVEDDPYSPLRFEGEPIPSIKSYDTDGYVFYSGSFSKMLAPAARLGWLVIPAELMPKITALREAIDLESSGLMQRTVAEFLRRSLLEPYLERLNTEHRIRRDALLDALQTHLGAVATWTRPEGGLFVWVTLPEGLDAAALVREAIDNNVVYIPGGAFASTEGYANTIRLNFSNVPAEKLRVGVERLSRVILKNLEKSV